MKRFFVLFSLLLLMACGKSLPALENFDSEHWKNDRNGCEGKRKEMIQSIRDQKDKLLSLKETQIVNLLGRPDGNELYERNQKFYFYHLTASPTCASSDSVSLQLELRFTAMGIVNEVVIK
jgi:hypothetical protein